MKAEELRNKTPDQLRSDLASLKKEQFNLRFQKASGQLENTARVRLVRRDIARVKTIAALKRAAGSASQDKPATKPKRAARSKSKSE